MDAAIDGLANKHNNNNNITLSNCIIYASVYETARERKSLTSGHHRPPLQDYCKEERPQEPFIYRYINYCIKHYIVCTYLNKRKILILIFLIVCTIH